ncbi:hypothetical protein I0C86_10785 [Plantactinospora sp. S1510]|uniref:Ig-like domain-containing protein n=1 Tax=Plantactinospora alkalitolerans TaxID=2789879 RepID=A0ABS0GTE2_9ACTN|nr:hypothetical protein [Plantactinospora alkalitolerans]MBF9129450.1 hypothetical protein [Plantactinospora alkalitolerans]
MTQPPDDEAPRPPGDRAAPVDPTESPSPSTSTSEDSATASGSPATPDAEPAATSTADPDIAYKRDAEHPTAHVDPTAVPEPSTTSEWTASPPPPPPPPYGEPGFAHPGPGAPYPAADGPTTAGGYPPIGLAPAPKKRRGLLVASIALATTLLLCVGGGVSAYLLLRNADRGEGAAGPGAAVDAFLKAVYTDRDPGRAADLTCPQARDDDKIAAKVEEVADQMRTHDTPRFRWTEPRIDEQDTERALVSTTLTMTTGDERTVDQRLGFIVVEENGWWVCDVV